MNAVEAAVDQRRRSTPSKGDLREAQILDVSRKLLADKTIDAVTIDELAAAAGISRTSFYFYFPTKNAVLAALMERVWEQLDVGYEWFRSSGPQPELLREQLRTVAAILAENAAVVRCAQRVEGAYAPLGEFQQRARARHDEMLSGKIERDRAAGLAPEGIAASSLAAMVTTLREGWFTRFVEADPHLTDRAVEEFAHAILLLIYGHLG